MSEKSKFGPAAKEAFKNKAFVRKLLTLETGEEVRKALEEKGIVLTAEELDKFAEILVLALEKGDNMTDGDLEEVVGGVAPPSAFGVSFADASFIGDCLRNMGDFSLDRGSFFSKYKKRDKN